MFKFLLFISLLLTSNVLHGQTCKATEIMSINILTGFQSFPPTDDIDQKLTANKFETIKKTPFVVGFEIGIVSKKSVFKSELSFSAISTNDKRPTLQPTFISFEYGFDLLQHASKTYLYPFGGIRYANWILSGQSSDNKELSTVKNNFDFTTGISLKQFLNDNLRGVLNNFDLNLGVSLPLSNGKWKSKDDTDASFIEGTFKNTTSFFITLTFGRAFMLPKN